MDLSDFRAVLSALIVLASIRMSISLDSCQCLEGYLLANEHSMNNLLTLEAS